MLRWEKFVVLSVKSIKNWKSIKYHIFCYKTLLLSSICSKCGSADEEIFMEGESIEILKILNLINNRENYQKIYNNLWKKRKSRIQRAKNRRKDYLLRN